MAFTFLLTSLKDLCHVFLNNFEKAIFLLFFKLFIFLFTLCKCNIKKM